MLETLSSVGSISQLGKDKKLLSSLGLNMDSLKQMSEQVDYCTNIYG